MELLQSIRESDTLAIIGFLTVAYWTIRVCYYIVETVDLAKKGVR